MYAYLAKDMNNAHDILLVHVVYSALDRDLNDLLPMGTTSASLIPLGKELRVQRTEMDSWGILLDGGIRLCF